MTVELTTFSDIGVLPDIRHLPVVKPCSYHRGIALQIPAYIAKKLHINIDLVEYLLTVKEDGTLIFSPRARATPWAIGEADE